jgi:hypothetical protein
MPYDVTPGGQKFVVVTLALEPGSHPLTLALNWPALLKKQRQQWCRKASGNGVWKTNNEVPGG